MKYNYSAMKHRFDKEQKKLSAQYHAAGMSEEAIKEMHEFDLKAFRLQRNDIIHKAEIEEMTSYDRITGESHYKDMDEFPAQESYIQISVNQKNWLHEIEDPALLNAVQMLKPSYQRIVILLMQGYKQRDIAVLVGVTEATIADQIKRIQKNLKEFL